MITTQPEFQGVELPPELARRVKQLETRLQELEEAGTPREDNEVVARLLISIGEYRPLSPAEKIRLSDAVRMKVKYKVEPSIRRADWHGDNVR